MSDQTAPDVNGTDDGDRRVWRRAPLIIAVLGISAVLAAAAWWQVETNRPPAPAPQPSPTAPSPGPTPTPEPSPAPSVQQTLLVQVRDDRALAVCNIQMASGGLPDEAVFVGVPPGLLVNAGPAGETTLARTALLSDTLASQTALALQLGLRIDGALTMDRLAFAGLVDAVDGVSIEGPLGPVQLTGTEAADYVISREPLAPESERMARCSQIWQLVLLRLPDDSDRLRQVIISLGVLARVTLPVDTLVSILIEARREILVGARVDAVLPTAVVRPGSDQTDVALQPQTSQLMREAFPEAVLKPGDSDPPRVYVSAAAADPFTVVDVRDRLVEAGYGVVVGEPLGTSRATRISVPSEALLEVGVAVAGDLGLPADLVRIGIMQDSSADVQVVIGSDPLP